MNLAGRSPAYARRFRAQTAIFIIKGGWLPYNSRATKNNPSPRTQFPDQRRSLRAGREPDRRPSPHLHGTDWTGSGMKADRGGSFATNASVFLPFRSRLFRRHLFFGQLRDAKGLAHRHIIIFPRFCTFLILKWFQLPPLSLEFCRPIPTISLQLP